MNNVATIAAADDLLGRVSVVLPQATAVRDVLSARPLLPFSTAVLAFVDALGATLRNNPEVRRHPELVALGFWARKSNIARLRVRFEAMYPGAVRLPKGRCLHFAPSNVDTIFVYSLLLAMLAGNVNLVRISSRAGEQANLLLEIFARCLAEAHPTVREANAVIRYEHDAAVTDALSAAVDLRIVWGGDDTVQRIRQSPLAPAGSEIVFPNKFSLALLDATAWLSAPDQQIIARNFVNDCYWFGQMACSSPRAIVWRGCSEEVDLAADSFWKQVEKAIEIADVDWEDAYGMSKLLGEQEAALESSDIEIRATYDNRLRVICCGVADLEGRHIGNGFFRQARVDSVMELLALSAPHWQTVTTFGVSADDWRHGLSAMIPSGIDRIVPIGAALNFDALWDGKDLLTSLTRLSVMDVAF